MAARALLFDLDGTLWDSHPVYQSALGAAADGLAARLRNGDNLVRIVGSSGVSRSRFVSTCTEHAIDALYADVPQTFQMLGDRGTAMGVVTNLPAWLVNPILERTGLSRFFSVVKTAAGKPRSGGLAGAAAALGIRAEEMYFVGDGHVDASAAKSARVRFAWAAYGYLDDPPPGTEAVLRTFGQVLEL